MRRVVTGRAPDGRSTVVADGPPPRSFGSLTELWTYTPGTPARAEDPTVAMTAVTDAPVPGGTAWRVTTMPPGQDGRMHRTPTVDYDVVLDGRVTLVLEDGEVALGPGDFVVMTGVMHAWRTDADSSCTIAFVNVHRHADTSVEQETPDG
jgi:quercetin dioxygenase-like cupin family protein